MPQFVVPITVDMGSYNCVLCSQSQYRMFLAMINTFCKTKQIRECLPNWILQTVFKYYNGNA